MVGTKKNHKKFLKILVSSDRPRGPKFKKNDFSDKIMVFHLQFISCYY